MYIYVYTHTRTHTHTHTHTHTRCRLFRRRALAASRTALGRAGAWHMTVLNGYLKGTHGYSMLVRARCLAKGYLAVLMRFLRDCACAAPTPNPTGTPAPTNVGDTNPRARAQTTPPALAMYTPTLPELADRRSRLRRGHDSVFPGGVHHAHLIDRYICIFVCI